MLNLKNKNNILFIRYIAVFLLFVAIVNNHAGNVSTATAEYNLACTEKNIYSWHFEGTEDNFTNSTSESTIKYLGTSGAKIQTTDVNTFSVLTIPPEIVSCYMLNRMSKISGYYFTQTGKYFEISGEYTKTVNGAPVICKIAPIQPAGVPFWKRFDFYFDFTNDSAIISSVTLKVQSPDAAVPLYTDEIVLSTFCDGKRFFPRGPELSSLALIPGILTKINQNEYNAVVPDSTTKVFITPGTIINYGTTTPKLFIRGAAAAPGTPSQVNLAPGFTTTPVDIFVKNSACEQTSYIVNVKREGIIDPALVSLKTSAGSLSPDFYSEITNYTLYIPGGTTSLLLSPVSSDQKATIRVNGQIVQSGSDLNVVAVSNGSVINLTCTARDNVTTKTYTINVVVDNTPPVISVSLPSVNPLKTCNNYITIAGTASDNRGVVSINYTCDAIISGSGMASGTSNWLINNLYISNGKTAITIKATDLAGNSSSYILKVNKTNVLYVDNKITTGANDGSSWANAFRGRDALDRALDQAYALNPSEGNEIQIWVAKNNHDKPYLPRSMSFYLNSFLYLYGGFAGGGNEKIENRDVNNNETTLSGDLSGDDGPDFSNISDNSAGLIYCWELTNCTIDGFTITGAHNNNEWDQGSGIFIYLGKNVNIKNCTFLRNYTNGSGTIFYNEVNKNESPGSVENCNFVNNYAKTGAGISFQTGINVKNCFFYGNKSLHSTCINQWSGYGIQNIENCVFSSNIATDPNYGSIAEFGIFDSLMFKNSTFSNNLLIPSSQAGIIKTTNTTGHICNMVMSDSANEIKDYYKSNITIKNSNIKGCGGSTNWNTNFGTDAGGNIDVDPLLISNYHLQSNSPCIDVADDSYAPYLDKDGHKRIDILNVGYNGIKADMGAYEYIPAP